MATILVTGVGGPAGRSLVPMLIERGHVVVGADMRPGELAGAVRYAIPSAGDPRFLPELFGLASAYGVDLLIPTVSEELPVVAAGRHQLPGLAVAVAHQGAVALANDKYLTWERLSASGVAVPRAILPSQARSSSAVLEQVGWPCLSKPRVSRGGRGVTVHTRANPAALAALDDHSILQEFAPGTEYAPMLYIRREGPPVAVVLEKTALRDGNVGNAVAVRRVRAPEVAAVAVAACRAIGLVGAADVDVRCRADGTPLVLEINARFGANSAEAPEILDALLAEHAPRHDLARAGAGE